MAGTRSSPIIELHGVPQFPVKATSSSVLNLGESPAQEFRERNLGLALADVATRKKSAAQMIEAFQLLQRTGKNFSDDPDVLTSQASLLFIAEDTQEAEMLYRRAVAVKPDFAPYQVNWAAALLKQGKKLEARQCLEKALELDPLLESGVQILSRLYQDLGETGEGGKTPGPVSTSNGVQGLKRTAQR